MEQLSGEHGYMMMRENQSLGMQRYFRLNFYQVPFE